MDVGVAAIGDELPGEHRVVAYRDGELVLTDRRIVYRGRGLARHQAGSVRVQDITSVGLTRRFTFMPSLLAIPLSLFSFGIFLSVAFESEDPFVFFSMLAFFSLPLPFLGFGLKLRVSTPGHTLYVRVRRADRGEARRFLQQVELARDHERPRTTTHMESAPTTSPFGR